LESHWVRWMGRRRLVLRLAIAATSQTHQILLVVKAHAEEVAASYSHEGDVADLSGAGLKKRSLHGNTQFVGTPGRLSLSTYRVGVPVR
jgi:hypothetical protein